MIAAVDGVCNALLCPLHFSFVVNHPITASRIINCTVCKATNSHQRYRNGTRWPYPITRANRKWNICTRCWNGYNIYSIVDCQLWDNNLSDVELEWWAGFLIHTESSTPSLCAVGRKYSKMVNHSWHASRKPTFILIPNSATATQCNFANQPGGNNSSSLLILMGKGCLLTFSAR